MATMEERTKVRPKRTPARPRPVRRRKATTERSHPAAPRREEKLETTVEELAPKTQGGGGSSGRGPVDDDDDKGRRRDDGGRDENRGPLLIALGIISLGAAVLAARALSMSGARGRFVRGR